VGWLARDWSGEGPLDLSRWLLVVPTRQAGRRLREALAELAATREQAVFPPRVVTPEVLVAPAGDDVAKPLVSLLAWAEVLREIDLREFREVLPAEPPERNFAWALRLARMLGRLQAILAEGGLRIADVTGRAGDFPEGERWNQLAELERRHAARLAAMGFRDAQAAKITAASQPPSLEAERIVVLAAPDPLPLAVNALAAHARAKPVEVVVFAPESEARNFDAWGRPESGHWSARPFTLPDFERRVHVMPDPRAQAELVATLARTYPEPGGVLGVGVADPEVLPWLEATLTRAGVPVFNPEGRSRRNDALHALLTALAALAASPDFEAAVTFLRCPDVLAWLRARAEEKFSPARLLSELDELKARHLPPTVAAALEHAAAFPLAATALGALEDLRRDLAGGSFAAGVAAALARLFGARRVETDSVLAESAETWMTILRETDEALARFANLRLSAAERWELSLEELAGQRRTADRPPEAIDLLGWLELLWEDAPHLVVAGCNDGWLPESVAGDVFLPETLRVRLGLKSNLARMARDAYLLAALAAPRAANGQLDLLLGRTSAVGEPIRPSPLLLRCADAELLPRVERLFRRGSEQRPGLPWSRAWQLQLARQVIPTTLSVTAVRDWLACPFRFYLRHGLKLTRVDPAKAELDARDFGTLLHAALQEMAEDATVRDCADADVLGEFLLRRFDRIVHLRYGSQVTLPLMVQFESARQRLRAAARLEARERQDGWRTERAEWTFSLPLGPVTLRGKIDRIDRHADGRVRVLDYKTADIVRPPLQTHLRSPREGDRSRPDWVRCHDPAGKLRVWADLQLPLYRRAVAAEFGHAVGCGYFSLPRAVGETAVWAWDTLTPELQAAAERCAEGVAAAVGAGVFWPPTELAGREAEWDEFAELFQRGAVASVKFDSEPGLTRASRPAAGAAQKEQR
jgi:ATP-dependent helicase/nuclease subunit B